MTPVRLNASSMWSKFGFGDGDFFSGFSDYLTDDQNHTIATLFGDYDPLIAIVETHLVSKIRDVLPDFDYERIESHHNPIRAKGCTGYGEAPPEVKSIYVDVTYEMLKEFSA